MFVLAYLLGIIVCYLATGVFFAIQYYRWYVDTKVKPWVDCVLIVLLWPKFAVV